MKGKTKRKLLFGSHSPVFENRVSRKTVLSNQQKLLLAIKKGSILEKKKLCSLRATFCDLHGMFGVCPKEVSRNFRSVRTCNLPSISMHVAFVAWRAVHLVLNDCA